ncbi:hypothetical protein K7X08_021049 [Anisodus acutangulus]|uniref:Uncharacterized protein n=1 Tax=Anisodus acutangulus TaxID=402998 RepID=A0A9Q1LZV9_9SOLA|nr:hypothetical protein K7X08_021049 [Anisodus acutangulus]
MEVPTKSFVGPTPHIFFSPPVLEVGLCVDREPWNEPAREAEPHVPVRRPDVAVKLWLIALSLTRFHTGNVHKKECQRLEQQMKHAHVVSDFPYTFSEEATVQVCDKQETRCSFLIKQGIHRVGMWTFECSYGASAAILDCSSH